MRAIKVSNAFKKGYKRMEKRGKDTGKIKTAINLLAKDALLPESYKDHALTGNFLGFRDCHVEPDWVLIYKKEDNNLFLEVTGTHSDLFK